MGLFPHLSLHSLAKKHGPIMLLRLGGVPTLVVSSADAAHEIVKTHDVIFSNRPKSSISARLLYGSRDVSVAPYGDYWRQTKSIFVLRLLSNRRVQSFRSVRREETGIAMKKIAKSSVVDLSELFTSINNDVVCRAAFGRKYGDEAEGKRFTRLLREFLAMLGKFAVTDFIPWLGFVDRLSGLDGKIEEVAKEVDEFLEGVVEEHLEKLRRRENGFTVEREDFVDILVKIHMDDDAGGAAIDRDSIKALILDVFSAGTDTTATVLEWEMTELLRHPTIMKNVQSEVRTIVGAKHDVTDEDLDKMHYLKAVIKETLRFHPPIPLLVPRESTDDVQLNGYKIAAGTMVITNAWTIGRDPSLWNEPETFRPERFLKEEESSAVDYRGRDFQLIPFGAGRRGCPGVGFAMAMNDYLLANLLCRFDWGLPEGVDMDVSECPGVTIHRRVPLVAVATPWSGPRQ